MRPLGAACAPVDGIRCHLTYSPKADLHVGTTGKAMIHRIGGAIFSWDVPWGPYWGT